MSWSELKEAGNEKFKNGEYWEAVALYTKSLECDNVKDIYKAVVFNNRAMCYLKMEKFQEALEDANQSLEITPNDPKTLYRRCVALEKLGRFEEAFNVATMLSRVDPKNGVVEPTLRRLGGLVSNKFVAQQMSEFLGRSQDAVCQGDTSTAKRFVLQAIKGADNEKKRLLKGEEVCVSEHELAEWYGLCAAILNQIGDHYSAPKYFYTASVFAPDWNVEMHAVASKVVWDMAMYCNHQLPQNVPEILHSLAELETLAKLAETLKKWEVCIVIDDDISTIYIHLKAHGFIKHDAISTNPQRRASLWRTARCLLKLGRHQDIPRICKHILHIECNDSEALEIWAQSLYETEKYELALDKCQLSLNHCQDGGDRQRLERLKCDIEEKMTRRKNEVDNAWLKGTCADSRVLAANAAAKEKHKPNPEKKKKRNRRSNRNRSQQNATVQQTSNEDVKEGQSRSQTPESEGVVVYQRTKAQDKPSPDNVHRLHFENVEGLRSRNPSSCSAATTVTDISSISTDMSFEDFDISEPDSSDENEENNTFLRAASPDLVPNEDLESEMMRENTTFYEQSQRFHSNQNEESFSQDGSELDGKYLSEGIHLNKSFLHRFEDRRPSVLQREVFYSKFLSKDELRQKMHLNPKKYVTCVIQIEAAHEAYCTPVDSNVTFDVIEISGRSNIGKAFDQDEVVVEVLDQQNARNSMKVFGRVIGVWKRHRHGGTDHPVFICTLDAIDCNLVRPLCKTIPKIHVLSGKIKKEFNTEKQRRHRLEIYEYNEKSETLDNPKIWWVNPGNIKSYIVLVAFIKWGERHIYPLGAVFKILNSGTSISTGYTLLTLQHEVPSLYAKETVEQVSSILNGTSDELPSEHLQGRMDLTSLNTFTIDPPDSKDLDDALSIEYIEDGYKVGVHISDVSAFIAKDSPLDVEARSRATTFYPGIRNQRNMIPEPLSANHLSLLANKIRLTISVFFYVRPDGTIKQMEEIRETYTKSKRQLTYDEAQNIILSKPNQNDDNVAKDVRSLFRVAHKVRKRRLGNAMFAIQSDSEKSDGTGSDSVEAHYLVEEFMILANLKVAEILKRVYKDVVPLRCQPPPSQEHLEDFLNKNNNYIDIIVQFQGKTIGSTKRNVYACLSEQSTKSVIVARPVWEAIKSNPRTALTYLRKDDIHPLQVAVYQHWLSIQEQAGYRCSGNLSGLEDGKHYSLNMFPYTHFTSPIRRYNDLIVHRLIHSYIKGKHSPYTKEEIDNICIHSNSVMKRAKAFEKNCRSLQQAVNFKTNPKMIACTVDEVTDKGLTLCSPLLKNVMKNDRQLPFNLLDMGSKPEVVVDRETNWSKVKAVWRKRLYDFHYKSYYPPDKGRELQLNPNKGNVFIPLHEWAKMVKCAIEGREQELGEEIENATVERRTYGLDDVSTESLNPLEIQPNTKFCMTYSRGHTVHIQMSAVMDKGVVVPKPVMYSLTNNVKFCLQHTADPVGCLTQYARYPTCDKYKSVNMYLERWLPIMSMEAAAGVIRNEESCSINGVHIKFTTAKRGKFILGIAECEIRNIELAGTRTISDNDEEGDNSENGSSYDWLCLKTMESNCEKRTNTQNVIESLQAAWVGHAQILRVKKKTDSHSPGKISVTFELHVNASTPVLSALEKKFSVEILRKSEVDRRSESYVKSLPSMKDSLACKIALNQPIPELDTRTVDIASQIERDLTYDASDEDPERRALPKNNTLQQEAIDKALNSRFSLIQGPPGTGKTNTGIKLLYLFNKINRIRQEEDNCSKQVLYCGPSNKSVDLVADWMLHLMGKYKPNFVRVYGRSIEAQDFPIPGRTFQSKKSTKSLKTDEALYPVTLHHIIRKKDKKHAEKINYFDKLFKDNNYQQMPDEVKEYVHLIREASIDEIRKYDIILCTTAVGSNPKVLKATSVQQVIVDEAGMCPEPQCLVPIIATKPEQVVLIGDHKQLRPIIMCKEAALLGYETSLFERYALCKSSKNVKFTMLEEQYRMHPEICSFPSRQFYEDNLKTKKGPWCGLPLTMWPRSTDPGRVTIYPHVLVHVEGEENVLSVSTEDGNEQSRSNLAEIDHVMKVYRYLTTETSCDVQILSQYNAQCSELRRRLDVEVGSSDVNVSTVVSSQGGEWDYVIFSTVRSLPDYKIEQNPTLGWCKHNLGFITDQNQVNVALTRAKKGLIIIGNRNLLNCDRVWKELISDYERAGCVKSAQEFPPPITSTRLERMRRNRQESKRRYGPSVFRRGTATSYEGNFDEEERGPVQHRRTRNRYEL